MVTKEKEIRIKIIEDLKVTRQKEQN